MEGGRGRVYIKEGLTTDKATMMTTTTMMMMMTAVLIVPPPPESEVDSLELSGVAVVVAELA